MSDLGPFARLFVGLLVITAAAMITLSPWLVAWIWMRDLRTGREEMNPIGGLVAVWMCLFELALLGDYVWARFN